MLCPFCGKERRDLKRCPKCHKAQNQRWRGVTEVEFMSTLHSKDDECTLAQSNDTKERQRVLGNSISKCSRKAVSRMATRLVNRIKRNTHGHNK